MTQKEHVIELGNSIINNIVNGWRLRVKAKRKSGVWKKRSKVGNGKREREELNLLDNENENDIVLREREIKAQFAPI